MSTPTKNLVWKLILIILYYSHFLLGIYKLRNLYKHKDYFNFQIILAFFIIFWVISGAILFKSLKTVPISKYLAFLIWLLHLDFIYWALFTSKKKKKKKEGKDLLNIRTFCFVVVLSLITVITPMNPEYSKYIEHMTNIRSQLLVLFSVLNLSFFNTILLHSLNDNMSDISNIQWTRGTFIQITLATIYTTIENAMMLISSGFVLRLTGNSDGWTFIIYSTIMFFIINCCCGKRGVPKFGDGVFPQIICSFVSTPGIFRLTTPYIKDKSVEGWTSLVSKYKWHRILCLIIYVSVFMVKSARLWKLLTYSFWFKYAIVGISFTALWIIMTFNLLPILKIGVLKLKLKFE